MKKIIIALFVVALVAMLPLSALAATGINQYEQEVLDKLASCQVVDNTGKAVTVPQEYINAARNYFLGDFDMTKEQRDAVMAKINDSLAVAEKEIKDQEMSEDGFKFSDVDAATRDQILGFGKDACEEIDLNMSFNAQDKQVIITSSTTQAPVLITSNVIKTTGQDFPVTAGGIIATVAVVLVLGTAVIFGVSKKTGLLVK